MPDNDINDALGITAQPVGASSIGKDPAVNAALRYRNGYRMVRFLDNIGTAIKVFGVIVSIIIFGLCMSNSPSSFGGSRVEMLFFTISLLLSVMSGGFFFILGVIVSAQSHQLKATLDSVVNSSPFLDVPAKARVMLTE